MISQNYLTGGHFITGSMDFEISKFVESKGNELSAEIAENYFYHNFGSISKSNLDTLIFKHFYEYCKDNGISVDDYCMSRMLGITEGRVRGLKQRMHLQDAEYNPDAWKRDFVNEIPNAKYSEEKKLVQMNIDDVNLMQDLRYFMRSNKMFDEYHLNPRLFQCNVEFFVKLCKALDGESVENEEWMVAVEKIEKIENRTLGDNDKSLLGKCIEEKSVDAVSELLVNGSKQLLGMLVESIVPGAGLAKSALIFLAGVLKK